MHVGFLAGQAVLIRVLGWVGVLVAIFAQGNGVNTAVTYAAQCHQGL